MVLATKRQQSLFGDAKLMGFVVMERETDIPAVNAYYQWCKHQNYPFVEVRPRRKYAQVSIDAYSMEEDFHPAAIAWMKLMLIHFSLPGSTFHIGPNYCAASKVLKEDAEMLASILWTIAVALPITIHEPANGFVN